MSINSKIKHKYGLKLFGTHEKRDAFKYFFYTLDSKSVTQCDWLGSVYFVFVKTLFAHGKDWKSMLAVKSTCVNTKNEVVTLSYYVHKSLT